MSTAELVDTSASAGLLAASLQAPAHDRGDELSSRTGGCAGGAGGRPKARAATRRCIPHRRADYQGVPAPDYTYMALPAGASGAGIREYRL